MSAVLRFPGHRWYRCSGRCEPACHCCNGLSSCTTCGGGEGSLPTDCPGRRMTCEEADAVYAGTLDFRRAAGWSARMSKGWEGFR